MEKIAQSGLNLSQVVEMLDTYDDNQVICAIAQPKWHPLSKAMICIMAEDGELSPDTTGMRYMLEVWIAKEVLDVWQRWRNGRTPSPDEKVEAIIYYAENDAYIPIT